MSPCTRRRKCYCRRPILGGGCVMLEWLLVGTGVTGAFTLVWLWREAKRKLGLIPALHYHFSPKGGCTEAIVAELSHARRQILVQAYSFTCPSIADALIA